MLWKVLKMETSISDCVDEFVNAEHLGVFSVVESFCDQCGDLTPHHIDDSEKQPTLDQTNTTLVPPPSIHECVICREEEESMLE